MSFDTDFQNSWGNQDVTLRALRNPGRSPRPCGGGTPFEVLGKSIWVERDHVPCLVLMFSETTELYAFVKNLTLCQSYPGLVIFSFFFFMKIMSHPLWYFQNLFLFCLLLTQISPWISPTPASPGWIYFSIFKRRLAVSAAFICQAVGRVPVILLFVFPCGSPMEDVEESDIP